MKLHQFAQKAFILRGDHVLVAHKASGDPHNPGRWEVPGGRMIFGEDVDDHICREVREETGLEIVPGEPFYIWQWIMSDPDVADADQVQVIAVARRCETEGEDVSVAAQEYDDHLAGVTWVHIDELLKLDLIPSLRPAAEAFVSRHRNSVKAQW
jgi:8-oxo-dGTP pyrophosphatase MutT (NUDIX family)